MERDRSMRSWLAILLVAPAPSLGLLAAMVWFPGPLGQALFTLAKAWMLLVPLVWRRLHSGVDPNLLAPPKQPRDWRLGLVLGVVISGGILGFWFAGGRRLVDPSGIKAIASRTGLANPWLFLAGALYWITVNSLLEEIVFRRFLSDRFRAALFPAAALAESSRDEAGAAIAGSATVPALLSGLVFTVHHTIALAIQGFSPLANGLASAGILVGGAIWSWLTLKSGSIGPAWLSHAIVDVAVFLIAGLILFGPGP